MVNLKKMEEVLEFADDLMENISNRLVLRSNIEVTTDEQKELVNVAENVLTKYKQVCYRNIV